MRPPSLQMLERGGLSGRGARAPGAGRRARKWCLDGTTGVWGLETQMGIGAARAKLEGVRGGDVVGATRGKRTSNIS